jgi:hypothetical protein
MDGGDRYFKKKSPKNLQCHVSYFDGLMKNDVNMTLPW